MRTQHWPPLALLLAFGFLAAGCTTAYGAQHRRVAYRPAQPAVVHVEHTSHAATPEYRRIARDADRYADLLDRELRLSNRQERDIERLLIDRARDMLRNTSVRNHRRLYPFPRGTNSHAARTWWSRTDRSIERMLHPRQRSEYRSLARYLDRQDGRNGRYDDRGRGRGRGR